MDTELLLGHLSCGPLMSLIGYIFYKFPPKEINMMYGYRTNRSMKNKDVWEFANKKSANYLLSGSLITSLIQGLFIFLGFTDSSLLYSFIILFIFLGLSIWKTETEISKNFDKNGNRL
jgi:uncharacterized membrane protein